MSTYLELVQELHSECGVSGAVPSTVIGLSGINADLARWIRSAYVEIQNRKNGRWSWLRSEFELVTTAGQSEYDHTECTDTIDAEAVTRLSVWNIASTKNPAKIYRTSSGKGGETWLSYLDWDAFCTIYKIGTHNNQFPSHITIRPNGKKIVLGSQPDEEYTVSGEYYKSAQHLELDTDVPEMPAQYHQLIVYRAMEKYGAKKSADEVIYRAEKEGGRMLRQLTLNQAPRFGRSRPLA